MTENTVRPNSSRIAVVVILGVAAVVGALVGLAYLTGDHMKNQPGAEGTHTVSPTATGEGSATATPSQQPTPSTSASTSPPPTMSVVVPPGGTVLAEDMQGPEALEALGDNISVVANRNGMTVEQLTELLERDVSIIVTKRGDLIYPGRAKRG